LATNLLFISEIIEDFQVYLLFSSKLPRTSLQNISAISLIVQNRSFD